MGINVQIVTLILCAVCIFYTTIVSYSDNISFGSLLHAIQFLGRTEDRSMDRCDPECFYRWFSNRRCNSRPN